MADKKISELPLRTAIAGTDEIVTRVGNLNYRSPLSSIVNLASFTNAGKISEAVIPSSTNLLQTLCYMSPGDGGGGIYQRANGPADIQSLDGAWWALVPVGPLRAAALGAFDGAADNEPSIKVGLYKHTYQRKGSALELPVGSLNLGRGIHVGYGTDLRGGRLCGSGMGFKSEAFPASTMVWSFTDEPAISVQGGRNIHIEDMTLSGPGASHAAALGTPSYEGFADDTQLETWFPSSWSSQATSRYAPAAAIAVDPRTAPADGTSHYRDVAYPIAIGTVGQYDKIPSSRVTIENVDFYGGGVGVVVHPNKDSDGGGDLIRLTNCRMTGVAVGFSIGQTQAKQTSLDSVDMASVHTAVTTFLHGKQTGIFTSAWNCNFSGIQLYDIQYDENNTGDVVFNNVNSEALWRIGTSPKRVVLNNCNFNFANQNENRGVPAMLVAFSLETNGGEWKNFEGCASIYAGINHVAIDGTVMLPRIATTLQDMCFQNGTAGGLVFALLASNSPIENINPRFRPWYFESLYQDISAYGLDSYFLSSRTTCTPLWSKKHGSWYPPEVPVDIPSRVTQFSLGTGIATASMSGLTLTTTWPARTDQNYMLFGPLPGDVLLHEPTSSVFVCMTANTTTDVVTFELLNNYRGLEPRDPINLAVGEQFILGSLRWYSPQNAVYGIFTSGSAIITDAGSRYDGGGTQVASRLADDLAVGDWLVVDPALAPFIAQADGRITAISEGGKTITLTGNATGSSTKRVRLGTFVRPGVESLGAALLLRGELDGFAANFKHETDANRVAVKVNNQVTYSGISFFTNTSTSPKWIHNVTGTLVSNPAGTLALDYDPITHQPLGLLVEPASTNTMRQSNAIGINVNVDWGGTGQFTMNATTAPDGTMTGTKFTTFPSANGTHLFGGAGQVGLTGTYSLYAKAAEFSKIFLRNDDQPDNLPGEGFDLITGKIFTLPEYILATGGAKIQNVGNGWYRCSIPVSNGEGSPICFIVRDDYEFGFEADASGTTGVYVWGAQLETTPVPTSLIPTTTAAVTRAADAVRITPASINHSSTAGTWVADVDLSRTINNSRVIGYTTDLNSPLYGTASNSFALNDGNILARDVARGSGRNKVAVTFSGNDKAVTANGLTPTTSTAPGTELLSPGAFIGIGQDAAGGNQIHGHINTLTYIPRKVSEAELKRKTALPVLSPRFAWNRPGGLVPHSSGREVYAWWFYFYRSFDNQPKAGDLYTNFLADAGFQSTPEYGASLRDRPTSRDPIPPEEDLTPLVYFKVKDMQYECETAWDMGLDGFQVNIYGLDELTSDGQHLPTLLEGARRAELNGKSVNIIIGLDGGILSGSPPEDLADYVRKFMHHPKAKKIDGKLVLGCFAPDITKPTYPECIAYWQAVIDRIGATIDDVPGLPVYFAPSFLGVDPFIDPGWQAMCGAMGFFGSNSFSQQANIPDLAETVMDAGIPWVAPLWPQDYRPNAQGGAVHNYRECSGSKLYRAGWEQAIAARDYNSSLQKMALIVTWNDFSEHGHICPSEPLQGIQDSFANLTAYYCAKYKTGVDPLIVRDQLMLFHRIERTDTYPATGSSQPATTTLVSGGAADAATNDVEALAYLTSTASLEADRGDGVIGTIVTGTGLQVATVPLVTGQTPKARIKRDAVTVLSLTSDFAVRASSTYQNLLYHGKVGYPTDP